MEIRTLEDIEQIAKTVPKNVTFLLPALDDTQNKEWSNRFNELLKECGCSSGQQYLMFASPFFIVAFILLSSYTDISKRLLIGLFAVALIITGVTGKLIGLRQRNLKIRSLLNQLFLEYPTLKSN